MAEMHCRRAAAPGPDDQPLPPPAAKKKPRLLKGAAESLREEDAQSGKTNIPVPPGIVKDWQAIRRDFHAYAQKRGTAPRCRGTVPAD